MVATSSGLLRVVSPQEVTDAEQRDMEMLANSQEDSLALDSLAAHIRTQWQHMRNWRSSEKINLRLLDAIRAFKGRYSPEKIAQINQFGGSSVYARMTAVKCRGATALLRDVYLSGKAWAVEPTPDPVIPEQVTNDVMMKLQQELMNAQRFGIQIDQAQVQRRMTALMAEAHKQQKKHAALKAERIEERIEDVLIEGGFYDAFAEFLVDLPLFPFAVMKGPVVRIVPELTWQQRTPVVVDKPKLFWERVNPFDFYWSPGISRLEDAATAEKIRFTRVDLNKLIGLPGYNEDAIREVLRLYSSGYRDWIDETDTERADNEHREDPSINNSNVIDGLEFHGPVQGKLLLEYGISESQVPDPDLDYQVQCWVIGRYVIKAQINPAPSKRHPYFVSSYEKVPGTVMGNGLPDILHDIQEVANASLRALVNNMSIASGPQVVVNEDTLAPTEDGNDLYPWKRWRVADTTMLGASQKPVDFFQPGSNAGELLGIYEKFSQMADDISAIPRYVTGSNQGMSGAGRTASGLAMLMGNASKVLQNVAANIDRDVLTPLLSALYDMLILTDTTGELTGDESVNVKGVSVAIQKETERARQLEFLQVTANPLDSQIVGMRGRGAILRSVAETLGMDSEDIVPMDSELELREAMQQQIQAMQQQQQQPPRQAGPAAQAQGAQAPKPGSGQPPAQAPQQNVVSPRQMPPGMSVGQPRMG